MDALKPKKSYNDSVKNQKVCNAFQTKTRYQS